MGKRRSSRAIKSDPIERVSFHSFVVSATTSNNLLAPTIITVSLTPAFEARLAAIADLYQFYRFTRVKVHLYPAINAVTADDSALSVGYLPRIPNTAPSTHTMIMTMPASAYKGMGQTVKTTLNIPRSVLLGDAPLSWFQSVAGTEDAQWETQGQIFIGGTGSDAAGNFVYSVEGICEFKGRSSATQTPLYKPVLPVLGSGEKTSSPADREVVLVGGQTFKLVKA